MLASKNFVTGPLLAKCTVTSAACAAALFLPSGVFPYLSVVFFYSANLVVASVSSFIAFMALKGVVQRCPVFCAMFLSLKPSTALLIPSLVL